MEDGRNWKNDGERTLAEDGERRWPKMENDSGRSCVVVDGGKKMGRWREGGKIWGKLVEQKSENGVLQWFCFQILNFFFFLEKKNVKTEMALST
jgi:hypothetical protein